MKFNYSDFLASCKHKILLLSYTREEKSFMADFLIANQSPETKGTNLTQDIINLVYSISSLNAFNEYRETAFDLISDYEREFLNLLVQKIAFNKLAIYGYTDDEQKELDTFLNIYGVIHNLSFKNKSFAQKIMMTIINEGERRGKHIASRYF